MCPRGHVAAHGRNFVEAGETRDWLVGAAVGLEQFCSKRVELRVPSGVA
ncbi:hypothetical protein [Arthrobacter sp. SD76]